MGWPGNNEDGLTSECLFGGDDGSEFKFFTSYLFVDRFVGENEAGGKSAPGR